MTDAGRAKLPSDVPAPPRRLPTGAPVPKFIRSALAVHPVARRNFAALAPTYRRDYLRWITEAKKPETRKRRLKEAIRRLEGRGRCVALYYGRQTLGHQLGWRCAEADGLFAGPIQVTPGEPPSKTALQRTR